MSGGPRYETILRLASGGMATVWIGTVRGALGFRQLVAIKKPHPHLLSDPGFRGELVAEARLASMIRHANVVDVRDVEIDGESISLVMDFIEGASLGELLVAASKREAGAASRIPPRVAVRIVLDACAGLHAAHELVDERDRPVGLVHRDVSPQNVLVGTDGISRVTDFGVAKFARKNMQSTSEGSLKGKLAYMPPEYVRGETIDRRFDVFALGVVLWEALTGKRCFRGENEAETLRRLLDHVPEPVSSFAPGLEPLDAVVACALAKNTEERFQNAAAMGAALEGAATAAGLLGGHTEVAATLKDLVGPAIDERRRLVRAKLAHEPSVASLMGLPPLEQLAVPTLDAGVAAQAAVAATMRDVPPTRADAPAGAATRLDVGVTEPATTLPEGAGAPTKAAATPKMGGGAVGNATMPAASAVPSTQPMTPQMHGSALPPTYATAPSPMFGAPMNAQAASPRTLASASPMGAPFASPMLTHVAPEVGPTPGANTLRSENGSDPHLARDPSGYGARPPSIPVTARDPSEHAAPATELPLSLPPRRSLVPLFAIAVLIVTAGGALVYVASTKRTTADTTTTAASTASSSAGVSAPVSASAAPAPVVPAATPSVATTSSAPVVRVKPRPGPAPGPTSHPAPAPTPEPAPLPPAPTPPAPSATTKKPPDNPYN